MLSRDELPGYRVVALSRVSNLSEKSESSLNRQDDSVLDEFQVLDERYTAKMIESYRLHESASTMDRESLDEILEMAKNDEFEILMVWAVHRLTRATPWETVEYLLKLKKHEIILYSDRDGYYDWEDPDDASRLMDRVSNARDWRNEIVRGAKNGCRAQLKDGQWPYGPLGYALTEDKNGKIIIKDGYEWIPKEIFRQFEQKNDIKEVRSHIKGLIENQDSEVELPSECQIRKVLENEIFLGKLILKQTGELIREKEDLKIVDPELFSRVQDLRHTTETSEHHDIDIQNFPGFIYDLIARFGQEYVVENLCATRWCCPKCQTTDINISDTMIEYWGITLPKVYCKKDGCGYNGPVVRLKELNEIDSTLPLVCPECQRTSCFDVEVEGFGDEGQFYRYTCSYCDQFMIKDTPPNTYLRAIDNPNKIDLRSEQSVKPDNSNSTLQDVDASRNISKSHPSKEYSYLRPEVVNLLNEWFLSNRSESELPSDLLLRTAQILYHWGPLHVDRIKLRLRLTYAHKYKEEYESTDAMWASIVEELGKDPPGFEELGDGLYDFNPLKSEFPIRRVGRAYSYHTSS